MNGQFEHFSSSCQTLVELFQEVNSRSILRITSEIRNSHVQLSLFLFQGISELDLTKINTDNVNEIPAFLSSRYGILKGFLTRYEDDRLKIYSLSMDPNKSRRLLNEIDLNRILAFYNETIDAVPLKCRLRNDHHVQKSSQCRLIVDQITRSNEYVWVFPEESQRSFWIRAFLQRQFSYHALISPNFIFLTQIHLQQGFNAEKQQMTVVVYPQSVVLCSDMTFDKIDLRKTSNLSKEIYFLFIEN